MTQRRQPHDLTLLGDGRGAARSHPHGHTGSVTVNPYALDLETERILKSIACETELGVVPTCERIGHPIDGNDR